jgi:hypothetical protein
VEYQGQRASDQQEDEEAKSENARAKQMQYLKMRFNNP